MLFFMDCVASVQRVWYKGELPLCSCQERRIPMSPEENKAIARRHLEENWNQENLASMEEIFAPDCVFHFSGGEPARGIEALRTSITGGFRAGYSNVHITIED